MPDPSEASPAIRRIRWLGILGVAVLLGGWAATAMQPRVAGQFHDDGIYLATAKSLADGQGYRHASLPGTPVQTKYPPLYSALMAGVWKVAPEHPRNIVWFKAASALFLAIAVLLAGGLGARLIGGAAGPIVFAFLTGASPLVFPFSDYPLTELPFLVLCLGALVIAARGEAGVGSRVGNAAGLGVVCGLAFLVRQAALPLILAGAVGFALRRQWRPLCAFAVALAVLAVPWLWFKAVQGSAPTNALLAYYTGYEPSVLHLAASDPGLGAQIVLANVYYLWTALDLGAYLTYLPAARILIYPVLIFGLWRIFRRPLAFLPLFSILYTGLILLWPWHPSRYAIPLAPLIPLAVLCSVRVLVEKTRGSPSADRPSWERRAFGALSWAPAAALILMAVGWLAAFAPKEEGTTRMAFLARLEYDWRGFEETADWLRANTPPDAILATAYDPMYFLRTGRRGVRPWLHRPWTYFYPVGDSTPDIGTPDEIQGSLDELGADYLVIDPLDGYLEKDAAATLYAELLTRYSPPAYANRPVLRFVSSDSLHRVYELPRRGPPSGGPPGDGESAADETRDVGRP